MFKTYQDYRTAWDNAYRVDPLIPLCIDIELVSLCNLRCPMCFISDGSFDEMIQKKGDDGKPKRRLMPKKMAFDIIDQCAEIGVPSLKFNWRGESTIHPDYSEIINYTASHSVIGENPKRRFIELLVNTNANCKPHAIDGLMAATKVMVSLDSLNPNTYATMRRGGNLELAKSVIGELVRREHPNLWIRRVLTKDNEKEEFKKQVKATWGEKVKVSSHFCFDRNAMSSHEVGCDHDKEMERQYCGYPSQRIIITSEGKAFPCCLDLKEEMQIGDIKKNTIQEIWNSDKMQTLRKDLRKNIFKSEVCKNCESWMSYKSPKRKYVQDVAI